MTHRQRDTEGTGLSASPPRRLAALTSLLIFFTRPALSLALSLCGCNEFTISSPPLQLPPLCLSLILAVAWMGKLGVKRGDKGLCLSPSPLAARVASASAPITPSASPAHSTHSIPSRTRQGQILILMEPELSRVQAISLLRHGLSRHVSYKPALRSGSG